MLKFIFLWLSLVFFSGESLADSFKASEEFLNSDQPITVVVQMNKNGEPEVIEHYFMETEIYDQLNSINNSIQRLRRETGLRRNASLKSFINKILSTPFEQLSKKEVEFLKMHENIVNDFRTVSTGMF